MVRHQACFLFDCDGTLFDTEHLKAKSWGAGYIQAIQAALAQVWPKLTTEVSAAYRAGGTTSDVARHTVEHRGEWLAEELRRIALSVTPDQLEAARRLAKERIFNGAFPVSGRTAEAAALILRGPWRFASRARHGGFRIGLVTATARKWVRRYVQASQVKDHRGRPIDLATFFEVAVYGRRKKLGIREAVCKMLGLLGPEAVPDEADLREALRAVRPAQLDRFVSVEDSLEGVRAAKAAGIHVVAVPNDHSRDPRMAEAADLMLDRPELAEFNPEDLLARIAGTSR